MHSPPFDFEAGEVLLIDKPQDWTSFDVVNKIRYAVKAKTGHAGTLDPMATGLLILCTGKSTKLIEGYMAQEKEYTGTITFGASTPSYDAETEIDERFNLETLTPEKVIEAASKFVGELDQLPPIYSAIKKNGKKLYEYARKGETVVLQPRKIEIRLFELFNFNFPDVEFRVICSKGTYIRSLAHDLGKSLNNGAYLSSLRRTRIGDYKIEDSMGVLEFVEMVRGLQINTARS
jgi:tRNA pseudouridine55 synthase